MAILTLNLNLAMGEVADYNGSRNGIIDKDTGADDASALILAAKCQQFDFLPASGEIGRFVTDSGEVYVQVFLSGRLHL